MPERVLEPSKTLEPLEVLEASEAFEAFEASKNQPSQIIQLPQTSFGPLHLQISGAGKRLTKSVQDPQTLDENAPHGA